MPKPIQLRISNPCHEDWSKMTPDGSGRHCASCQKTVEDFTAMSDADIVRYMSRAGSNVCGRLLPDQMDRRLTPVAPVQRNGGKGWQLLLAGAMLTADGSLPRQPAIVGEMHMPLPPPPTSKTDSTEEVILGGIMSNIEVDTVLEVEPVAWTGDISLEIDDSLPEMKIPGVDTVISQVGDRHPCTPADDTLTEYKGEISVRQVTVVDSIRQFVKDTLRVLRILPKQGVPELRGLSKQELKIYPNPVSRGSAFHLAWQSEPGTYEVRLISVSGALIQSRVVQVGSRSQVDTWEMPGGLVAGVYIIQVIRPGQAGGFTQKVVVE